MKKRLVTFLLAFFCLMCGIMNAQPEQVIKILTIGNSFSEDATRYIHQIAESAGEECLVVNLYIGGCPLWYHADNIVTNKQEYRYERNGEIIDSAAVECFKYYGVTHCMVL